MCLEMKTLSERKKGRMEVKRKGNIEIKMNKGKKSCLSFLLSFLILSLWVFVFFSLFLFFLFSLSLDFHLVSDEKVNFSPNSDYHEDPIKCMKVVG